MGTQTNIKLLRRFENWMPYPYSPCVLKYETADINSIDSKFYREIYKKKKLYLQGDCFERAYILTVAEKCQCVLEKSHRKLGLNYPLCSVLNSTGCIDKVLNFDYKERNFDGKYDKECPLQCNFFAFTKEISYLNFPSLNYAIKLRDEANVFINSSLGRPLTFEDIKTSTASVKISYGYSAIGYYIRDEFPSISGISLISNIGGTLGLFLGMSFLSILEFVEFAYVIIITVLRLIYK